MSGEKDWIASHLFLAFPKAFLNTKMLKHFVEIGLIDQQTYRDVRRSEAQIKRVVEKVGKRGRTFDRLLSIYPEIFTVDLINLMRTGDVISKTQAHKLRLIIRSKDALRPRPRDATLLTRYRRLFGVGYSEESISLMRALGLISKSQGDAYRAIIIGSKHGTETIAAMRNARGLSAMMALAGEAFVDSETFRALKYAGVLDRDTADFLGAGVAMGKTNWRNFEGSKRVEGLAQRMLYLLGGSFNHETIRFLRTAKLINRREELILRSAVQVTSIYHRHQMEKWTKRRFRPNPNESPIKTFARASKQTDTMLMKLLAEVADDAKKTAMRLDSKAGIGAQARRTQLRAVTTEMHAEMRALWEGAGHLTIFGEREAALASLRANEDLSRKLTKRFDKYSQYMIAYNARANVDAYISRQENVMALSARVWKNYDLYTGKIDHEINKALLEGLSNREFADRISKYIRPNVRGGVSYAAMRLARTEINNASHITSIRYWREQPWIEGVKWNLSNSHDNTRPHDCDSYAHEDHDGIGEGVFKKDSVPGKPHPQCLCFLTAVTVDDDRFESSYRRGFYSSYLKSNASASRDGTYSWDYDGLQNEFATV